MNPVIPAAADAAIKLLLTAMMTYMYSVTSSSPVVNDVATT